jgi:hypothetical protein
LPLTSVSAVWHESFQFRVPVTSPLDFQKVSVALDVEEEHMFTSHVLGSTSFPLAFLYAQKDRSLRRRWVAAVASNTHTGDTGGITAQLRVSIAVTTPGQTPAMDMTDEGGEEEGEDDEAGGNILMPPTLERVGCVLNVAVYSAEGLPQMDFTPGTATGMTAGIDAYVRVRFAGGPWVKTQVVTSLNPKP